MITPRPAQKIAVPKARKALRKSKRALMVLATALGKTIASALVWKGFVKGRGLFLVHANGILEKAMKDYQLVYGKKVKMAVYNGHSKDIEGAEIVFATFQSMRNALKRFPRKYFAWMTVDESHHSQAETYRPVVEHFNCPQLAITATPNRMDRRNIRDLFGEEVINISLEEAIARGWLPRVEYHVVTDDGFDEEALDELVNEVMKEGKRLSKTEINRRVFIRARDEKVAEAIEEYREKTIVFCRDIAHAEHFRKFLKGSEVYHSDQHHKKNAWVLEDLRNGVTRRVLSVNAFNEGIDVPDVGLVVFYRATNSENIFYHQLGRGMRAGKEKLVVLDFVGNLERIQQLQQMAERIATLHEEYTSAKEREREGYVHERLYVSGKGFEFTFSDRVVELMEVTRRATADFYPTWQEAGEAAVRLGIKDFKRYRREYKRDPRLPSAPGVTYEDFPNWAVFLGGAPKAFYPTWQKASRAAIRMGIKNSKEYKKRYKEDSQLPAVPSTFYEDFPDWRVFVGNAPPPSFYPTWQQAGEAARKLKVHSQRDYRAKRGYKADPHLPSNPNSTYADWPGWRKFLGKITRPGLYPTWQQAGEAARRLGIKNQREYLVKKRYKANPRLPGNPRQKYSDFPGWGKFLGKK